MIDYISAIIEASFFLILSAGFLSQKINKVKFILSLLPLCALVVVSSFFPASQQANFVLSCANILIGVFSIMILTGSGIKTSLYCYIGAFVFGFAFQITFVILSPIFGNLMHSKYFLVIGAIYTLAISIIAYIFFDLHRLYIFLFETGKWGTLLLSNLFAICFLFALYFKLDKTQFLDIVMFAAISFFILVSINWVLFNQLRTLRIQSEQLKAYDKYLPVLDSLIQNVRIKQHHHANEIQSIIGLLHTCKDYDSLTCEMRKYLDISQENSEPDFLLKLNMPLVAGFLYHKKLQSSKNGIMIEYDIRSYSLNSVVAEYELVELFGILIDNAIDATPENGTVYVTVDSTNNKISFTTRNIGHILTINERTSFFTKGYSTKGSKHHSGLGLYHLKNQVITQHHGTVSLWNEGTDILFEITV